MILVALDVSVGFSSFIFHESEFSLFTKEAISSLELKVTSAVLTFIYKNVRNLAASRVL